MGDFLFCSIEDFSSAKLMASQNGDAHCRWWVEMLQMLMAGDRLSVDVECE